MATLEENGPHPDFDPEVEAMVRNLNPPLLEQIRRAFRLRTIRLLLAAAVLGGGGFELVVEGVATYLDRQAEEQRIQREEEQRQNNLRKERQPSPGEDLRDWALA